jgi:hypothetical protein
MGGLGSYSLLPWVSWILIAGGAARGIAQWHPFRHWVLSRRVALCMTVLGIARCEGA